MNRPTPDWAKSYDALRKQELTRRVEDYFSEHEPTVTVLRSDLEALLSYSCVYDETVERLRAALEEDR
jgi:hypothetical protein